MRARRQFFRLSLIAFVATVAERVLPRTQIIPTSRAQTPPATQPAGSLHRALPTQIEASASVQLATTPPTSHAIATPYPTPAPYATAAPPPATPTPQPTVAPLAQATPHQIFIP